MGTEINWIENVAYVVHEPGNFTRYEAIGTLLPTSIPGYGGSWLIVFPLTGSAYVFNSGAFVSVAYVAEKLGHNRFGIKHSLVDLHEMTKCISFITKGKHNALTDDTGRFSA